MFIFLWISILQNGSKITDNQKGVWATIQPHIDVVKSLPSREWDNMFLFIFPPHTKSGIGICNIRITDMHALCYKLDDEDFFWKSVNALPGKSYIFVCNILIYACPCFLWMVWESKFCGTIPAGRIWSKKLHESIFWFVSNKTLQKTAVKFLYILKIIICLVLYFPCRRVGSHRVNQNFSKLRCWTTWPHWYPLVRYILFLNYSRRKFDDKSKIL